MGSPPRPLELVALLVAVLSACSQEGSNWSARRASVTRAAEPEVVDAPPESDPDGGCESIEHSGNCHLESVVGVDMPQTGDREVVAVYRVLEPDVVLRIERRFRVSYLANNEADQIAFVREHSQVECHWQTVVRGACPAYPGQIDLPVTGDETREHHRSRVR